MRLLLLWSSMMKRAKCLSACLCVYWPDEQSVQQDSQAPDVTCLIISLSLEDFGCDIRCRVTGSHEQSITGSNLFGEPKITDANGRGITRWVSVHDVGRLEVPVNDLTMHWVSDWKREREKKTNEPSERTGKKGLIENNRIVLSACSINRITLWCRCMMHARILNMLIRMLDEA